MGGLSVPRQIATTITGTRINEFDEANAVASGNIVVIASFIVPIGKKFFLDFCEFSGDNIALYELFIGGVVEARKCTWFGGQLFDEFFFGGLEVAATKTIELKVTNFRPEVADFSGRINGSIDDA